MIPVNLYQTYILKLFKAKLPDTLKRRACLAILKCKDTLPSTGIIVASFHNPSRETDGDSHKDNATKLFSALENLRQMTGYPVLVGGDFNCELLKDNVERSHFIVPQYSPTIHRVLYASGKGKICIDFFAYKNCDNRRACSEIQLTNVEAKMLSSSSNSVLLKGMHVDYKEYQKIKGSILREIHDKSNHDPLTATLTIKNISPIYRMSCIFMNNPKDKLLNEIPISDFLLFHNINKDFKLLALPTSYDYCKLSDTVKLYCDNNRLQHITTNTFNISSLTYLVSKLKSKVKDDQTIFVALFYQHDKDQPVTKECVKKMFEQLTTTCNNSATWIIGNVNINENVKILKLPNISTKQLQGRGNNYFCACMNNGEFSNIHFETIIPTKYLEMNTAMKLLYNKEEILNGDLLFTTTDMHCLVSVSLDPGKPLQETYNSQNESHDATLPNKAEILCFNMGQVAFNDDESMSKIKCYFTKLDPKPNLFILQNSPADTLHYFTNEEPVDVLQKPSQTSICKALGVEESHDACCRSTIVYDKIKFKLVNEIRIASESFMITACILTCCTIDKNIIVASFHSCTQKNTKIENDIMHFRIAEECFKVLEKLNMILQYPVLVAGGFYIELDKEHKVSGSANKLKIDRKGFIVPSYNPLLHRVLHKVINHREDACIDTFAYKSSNTYAIQLNDVNPEAIDPCPSLVTGAYNIDYDKGICNLPKMVTEHDSIRAKMIIKPLPTEQASTSMQQTPSKPPPTTQSEYTPTNISTKASKTRRKL